MLLAALPADELDRTLAEPSRAGLPPYIGQPRATSCDDELARGPRPGLGAGRRGARARASARWPRRCGTATGAVRAAMNVTVHAAETTTEHLLEHHLPLLLRSAGDVSAEWALWQSRPHVEVDPASEGSG